MSFRKSILVLSALAMSMFASCTTRYQDMLRERDQSIRDLNTEAARMRSEIEELQRREAAALANASATPRREENTTQNPSEQNEIQNLLGPDAEFGYINNRLSIGIKDSVTFDSGSTALKDSSHRVLKNVASVLKSKFAGRKLYIEGHTDSDPINKTKDKYKDNHDLSYARAAAVSHYLVSQGISQAHVYVVACGPNDPVGSAKDKAANRRVQIVIGDKL